MRRPDATDIGLGFFGLLVALAFFTMFVFLPYAIYRDHTNQVACEARGGVWFSPRGGSICLNKELIK